MESVRGSDSIVSELGLLPHICELYIKTDRLEEADAHLAHVLRIAGDAGHWGALKGDILFAQGLVSAASLQWDDVGGAFVSAINVYQEYGLPWDEAKVYYEWANAIMANSNSELPASQASDLLRKALSLWEPMGASSYAELCRARLS